MSDLPEVDQETAEKVVEAYLQELEPGEKISVSDYIAAREISGAEAEVEIIHGFLSGLLDATFQGFVEDDIPVTPQYSALWKANQALMESPIEEKHYEIGVHFYKEAP